MTQTRIRISDQIYLNQSSHELIFLRSSGEKKVRVEPILVQLLCALVQAAGSVVSRENLICTVWDDNVGVGEKALTKNIYKLRKVFKQNGWKDPIETIPKKGYRLKLQRQKTRLSRKKKTAMLIAAVVLGWIILKLAFPELGHDIRHSLMH